jgi:hypothetical protein
MVRIEIAHATECAPKDPWSVKARFWDENIPGVILIITPMDNSMTRLAVQDAVSTMRKDVEDPKSRRKFRPARLLLWMDCDDEQKKLLEKCEVLSSHPHHYYTTYISPEDHHKIRNSGSRPNEQSTLVARVKDVNKNLFGSDGIPEEVTTSYINRTSVGLALANPKRGQTQKQVMGGVSATDVRLSSRRARFMAYFHVVFYVSGC